MMSIDTKSDRFDPQRRTFLYTAGMTACGLTIAAVFPFADSLAGDASAALASMEPFRTGGDDSVWDIDSACGHFPPYAHPIAYAPAQRLTSLDSPDQWGSDPLDRIFLA
jgi:hypothetical protein